ncbi:MAG: leucine-rich repeat domain-containing protein, partial [Bacteroidota bacterium]
MSKLALELIAKEKVAKTGYLDIGRCGLTELPEELFELTWLTTLVVSNRWWDLEKRKWIESDNRGKENVLAGKVPDLFGHLKLLENIRLGGEPLSRWRLNNINALTKLRKLRSLDVRYNQISDISTIQVLRRLQILYLSANQISDISALQGLRKLQTLHLSSNQISNISFLRVLRYLKILDIRDNQIAHIFFLSALKNLRTLDLRDNKISDTSSLQNLKYLQNLYLSSNQISDISTLKNLRSLHTLDLRNNQISDISALENLYNLQILDLRDNRISDISALQGLGKLKVLTLRNNQISDISFLRNLNILHTLNLRYNQISDISTLKILKSLQTLDLRYNQIIDISALQSLIILKTIYISNNQVIDISFLKDLKGLQTLDIRHNQIVDISVLQNLVKLEHLYLSQNQISDISALLPLIEKGLSLSLKEYDTKEKIRLHGNPIITPPIEIVKEGRIAIINYFKALEEQDEVPLYEAKLLIIGEGGSGKTSLARRLLKSDAPMPKEKESTKGIDIFHYDFKTPAGKDFRINIWDFGGQEIYHATHQFFLTKRSLYVLLDDTRKDDRTVNDPSFNYWFQVVELLSESSPVLIVQNEKANRSKQLDLKSMQGRFGNVKGSWATNILTCRGLEQVRAEIEHQVQQLPLVGQMLPKQW